MTNSSRSARGRSSLCSPAIGRIAGAILPLATILFSPQLAMAQVPTADVQNTCRFAAAAMVDLMGGTTVEQGVNGCLDSENVARAQIIKDWNTYSAADRTQCLQTGVYLPSYVEWLTCLEMERDVRRLRAERHEAPPPGPNSIMTLPVVLPKPSW
jgi:hypothetical protein